MGYNIIFRQPHTQCISKTIKNMATDSTKISVFYTLPLFAPPQVLH